MGRSRTVSVEQAAAAREETLNRLHQILIDQVSSLESVEAWKAWLAFANRFHRYSFNNTLLIQVQRPDATSVAGYRAWQAMGRHVMKGERAIKVLGPVTKRVPREDADGNPVCDEAGRPVFAFQLVGVKPVSVFDVSQTDGKPLPTPLMPELLTGQAPPGLWESLIALIATQGFRVSRDDCGRANGVTLFDQREVRVRPDVDDAQAVKTLAHEAGHVLLHAAPGLALVACRGMIEVEAESVAYLVTSAHGLGSSHYTFNYVTGWAHDGASASGKDVADIVQSTGERVIQTANRILESTMPPPDPSRAAIVSHALELRAELEPAPAPVPRRTSARLAALRKTASPVLDRSRGVGVSR